jgi:transcriptional regulator with XRE-family HTH domain
MTDEQCRLARAMLGWSAAELSRRAQVGLRTIREFEADNRPILDSTRSKLRAVFTVNGIEFLNDADGIGIKRRLSIHEYCQRSPAEQRV